MRGRPRESPALALQPASADGRGDPRRHARGLRPVEPQGGRAERDGAGRPGLVKLLYKPSQWQVARDPAEHDRRSIYLFAKRNLRLPFLEDVRRPDPGDSCPRRESSTHAPQALELLNGRLSNDLAAAFADRLARETGGDAESPRRSGLPPGAGPAADAAGAKRSRSNTSATSPLEGVRPGHVQPERVPLCPLRPGPPIMPARATRTPPRVRPRRLLRLRRPRARLDAPRGAGPGRHAADPLAPKPPHLPAKARSVIFLFMAGGPSHLETFDPKPLLNKLHGQPRPKEFGEAKYQFVQRNARLLGTQADVPEVRPERDRRLRPVPAHGRMRRRPGRHPVLPRRHGRPLGRAVRAVHRPGHARASRAWARGSSTASARRAESLPSYVVMPDPSGALEAGQPMYANGFLPAVYQPTMFRPGDRPVLNLDLPAGVAPSNVGGTPRSSSAT